MMDADTRTIYEIASAHGLVSRGRRGACPAGCVRKKTSRKDTACQYSDGDRGGSFRCFRCGKHGGVPVLLELLGESKPLHRARKAPPKRKGSRFKVDLAWSQLAAVQGRDGGRDGVRRWAIEHRGWSPDVAEILADSRDVLGVVDLSEHEMSGRALVRRARRVGARVVIPLRDHHGVTCSAVRRWTGKGKPKTLQLANNDVGEASRGRYLGRLNRVGESALEERPIYVVEGEIDYLAVMAATGGLVLGAPSHGGLPQLGEIIAERLHTRAHRASAHIILVVQKDDAGQCEKSMLAAAEHLAGLRVSIARMPEGEDAGDVLKRGGADELAHLLDGAELKSEPPAYIGHGAGERIEQLIRQAADDVLSKDEPTVKVLGITPSSGKSFHAARVAIEHARSGAAVVCYLRNHQLIQEYVKTLEDARGDAQVQIQVAEGQARNCVILKKLEQDVADAAPEHRQHVQARLDEFSEGQRTHGRGLCMGPESDDPSKPQHICPCNSCTKEESCCGIAGPRMV